MSNVPIKPVNRSMLHTSEQNPTKAGANSASLVAVAILIVLACLSAVAYYLGFTERFPLADLYDKPLLDLGKITRGVAAPSNWWLLAWAVVFTLYFLAFRLCPPATRLSQSFRRLLLAIICLAGAVFSTILLFMYPVTAADLYDQIFRGRITTHYSLNPFLASPGIFGSDPFLPFVAWKGEGSPYGPLWELLATIPSFLGGDDLWNNLIYFKFLVIIFYGLSTFLIYRILRIMRPEWALRGVLFFAWNPLVVYEIAGNGHNDAILVTFVLLAIYVFVRGYRLGFLPALMAGVLTKFIPALLVPIAIAALWRDRVTLNGSKSRGWLGLKKKRLTTAPEQDVSGEERTATTSLPVGSHSNTVTSRKVLVTIAIGGVVALFLAVVAYAPFWQGPRTVGALTRQNLFTASVPTLSYILIEDTFHISQVDAKAMARTASLIVTGLSVLILTGFVFLARTARTDAQRKALIFRMVGAFYEMTFIYLALANLWFQPWYLIWLVALTPLVALHTNANRTILFCIGGIMNYYVFLFLWNWSKAGPLDVTVMAVLTVYFLPLLYTLYSAFKPIYDRIWSREEASTVEAIALAPAEPVWQPVPTRKSRTNN